MCRISGLTLTANATAASKQYIYNDNSTSVPGREVYGIGARYNTKIAQFPVTIRGILITSPISHIGQCLNLQV